MRGVPVRLLRALLAEAGRVVRADCGVSSRERAERGGLPGIFSRGTAASAPASAAAASSNPLDYTSIVLGYALAVMVANAFAFIPSIAVTAVVEERETQVLHQQILSGASISSYWCANFVYDLLFFLPVLVGTVVVVVILQLPGISNDYLPTVVIMLIAFALQALPLAYIISHMFTSSVTAQVSLLIFFLITI